MTSYYWCASDSREYSAVLYLLSFDYSTERFARMCLPDPSCRCQTVSISVVREEKLAVLLRPHDRPGKEIEIWISSPIDDETKVVSWNKIFAMEDRPQLGFCVETSFLVDEGKKIAICRERWTGRRDKTKPSHQDDTKPYVSLQYIVGEDNEVTHLEFEASRFHSHWPLLFNYVPSLVQIQ
ncbi:putative F-box protein [Raphanus sativus]|nr:putative F-box protein [Raphanus sativus]